MSDSLADRAVHALALVAAMGENLSLEDPERHIVRNMKRTAEQAMSNAFQLACDLAYQAKNVTDTFSKQKDDAQ